MYTSDLASYPKGLQILRTSADRDRSLKVAGSILAFSSHDELDYPSKHSQSALNHWPSLLTPTVSVIDYSVLW